MNFKEVIFLITRNYEEIDACLTDMDLDLLPVKMRERTRLIASFMEDMDKLAVPQQELRRAICLFKEQNFRLESRVSSHLHRTREELEELYHVSERSGAYAAENRRHRAAAKPPGKEYC